MLPDLFDYSPAFLDRAAAERDALADSCDRVEPAGDCSAVQRLVRDYGIVRDQIRAIGKATP